MSAVSIALGKIPSLNERGSHDDGLSIWSGQHPRGFYSLLAPAGVAHWAGEVLVELFLCLGLFGQEIWLPLNERAAELLVHGFEHAQTLPQEGW